jgi:hypothetical protein
VTVLYRLTTESPPFGRRTFWAASASSAKELAEELEEGTSDLPGTRLYEVEVPIESLAHAQVDIHLLAQEVEAKSRPLQERVQIRAEQLAAQGFRWIVFTEGQNKTHWATAYMGDDPLSAEPVTD